LEPEVPDNIFDPMPPETYCKCGATWVGQPLNTFGPAVVNLRIKCQVCGEWTDAVPPAK
jgi:hypothetical protein